MTLEKIIELQNMLLKWNKDNICSNSDLIDCKECPFDKNKICERLQQISMELEEN